MAAEEDKKFDAALGGFLVNNLRDRGERLHCPEPEVLAAYHERSLLPEEMNSWKEHIVGCAHCQAILAELEVTDSIPLQASEEEVLVAGAAPAQAAATAAGKGRLATPVAIAEKPRVSRLSRGLRWQWLAPAGALAAGLLVWVAWHENQPLHTTPPSEIGTEKAERSISQEPAPSASQQAPVGSPEDQLHSTVQDQDFVAGIASAKKAAPEDLKQFEKFDSRAKAAAPAKLPSDKESGGRQDAARERLSAGDLVRGEQIAESRGAVAGVAPSQPPVASSAASGAAASQAVEVQSQTANLEVQGQLNAQNQVNTQKVAGPSALGQAEAKKKAKSEASALHLNRSVAAPTAPASGAQAPAPAPPPALSEVSATPAVIGGSAPPYLIFVPGTTSLWRVGNGGLIEFSSDGGASWVRQSSNVAIDLTSGSSPSAGICWVVGSAGAILLTTDAGAHWAILHSPLTEDLGGVRTVDALHATIWNSADTKAFATADGGATWKSVSPP